METTAEESTVTLGGKEYRRNITRRRGLEEVTVGGRPVLAEAVTDIEWPGTMGTTRNYTLARPERTPEEEAAFVARVQEAAVSALTGEGIW